MTIAFINSLFVVFDGAFAVAAFRTKREAVDYIRLAEGMELRTA
jgi:hypothetical protein